MRVLAAMLLALSAACMGPGDFALYDSYDTELSAQVQAYRAAAVQMTSPADCAAAVQQYLTHARPDLDGMRGCIGGGMGSAMMTAEMRCGMDVMSGELERHASAACGSLDMSANRAEAAQHCDVMLGYAEQMRMRYGGMMGWEHHMPGCAPDGG